MTEITKVYEICKGCRTSSKYADQRDGKSKCKRICLVSIPVLSETQQCPCITCLIKGMCLSGCEEFREYSNVIQRLIYNEKRSSTQTM